MLDKNCLLIFLDDLETILYDLDYKIPGILRKFREFKKLYKYATKIKTDLIKIINKRMRKS